MLIGLDMSSNFRKANLFISFLAQPNKYFHRQNGKLFDKTKFNIL
jgi:hypothetical protein